MKNKVFIKIAFLLLVGVVFIHYGCKKIVTDDLSINVSTDVFNAPTLIVFENAKEGATNQPKDFTITITGQDNEKITTSEASTNFTVRDGWIAIQLVKGVVASESKPIRFMINADIPGFEYVQREVSIVSNDENKIVIKVIENGNLPTGVIEKKVDIILSSGKFQNNEQIVTPIGNGVNESVKIDFEEGTTMEDAQGNLLKGTNLEANVRYYDNSDQSISVFPGGLNPQKVKDENGNEIEGGVNFFTAGLVDIDLKIDGKIVKNFSKPVSAEMMLSPNLDNFATGEKVKVGDTIPLWSYDEASGVWSKEGVANVFQSENGTGLVAKFKLEHLSPWNMDWFWNPWWQNFLTNFSYLNVRINAPWANYNNYLVTTRTANGNYLSGNYAWMYNGTSFSGWYSRNIPQYLEIFDYNTYQVVAKTAIFNPLQQRNITINIPKPSIQYVDVSMNYSVSCASNKKINPNKRTWVYLQDLENNRTYYYYSGSKGVLNIRLINGRKYRISTRGINGELISCESVFDVKNLKYDNIKGLEVKKLIYNPTTNRVEIDCLYTISKC
jgi:hypothetical protein